MKIEITYDKNADSVYLHFSDQKVAYSKQLDAERSVDYSEEGEIRGIQFLSVSSGLKTDDLPYKSTIERALGDKGFKRGSNRGAAGLRQDANNPGEAHWQGHGNARMAASTWTFVLVLFFTGSIAADILLTRNMFVVKSALGQIASLCGLVVALFPTVIGSFMLLLFLDARGQASRF